MDKHRTYFVRFQDTGISCQDETTAKRVRRAVKFAVSVGISGGELRRVAEAAREQESNGVGFSEIVARVVASGRG